MNPLQLAAVPDSSEHRPDGQGPISDHWRRAGNGWDLARTKDSLTG